MALAADIITWLLSKTAITDVVGSNVHQDHVPESIDEPYVWFGRAGTNHERCLGDATGTAPFEEIFNVECIDGSGNGTTTDTLATAIRALDGTRGTVGSGTVQAIFLEDESNDYQPRGIWDDEGAFVAAFRMRVFGYLAGS